jgi:hypothetical protein
VGPDLGLAGPVQLTSSSWAGEVGPKRGGGVAASWGFQCSRLIQCRSGSFARSHWRLPVACIAGLRCWLALLGFDSLGQCVFAGVGSMAQATTDAAVVVFPSDLQGRASADVAFAFMVRSNLVGAMS